LRKEPFYIVELKLPSGHAGVAHLSISDPSGDSAIFEYVDGKFVSGEVTRHFRTANPFAFAGVKN
jgi:choloylglycine hydrolase